MNKNNILNIDAFWIGRVSNPKFEYWLLLHFKDASGVTSSMDCSEKLRRHLPDYDKGIRPQQITKEQIGAAIKSAQTRDNPPCKDWPSTYGTTVYRLVGKINSI